MTEPLSSDHKVTLTEAAQVDALTKPVPGTSIGKRTEKRNAELRDSQWYRDLQEDIRQGRKTREEADEVVRSHGVS